MSMGGALGKFIAADAEVGLAVKVYHRVNLALLGATPVALATDNTFLSFPVDMGLAIMFPLHGHIGMNYVITDYVPKLLSKAAVGPARADHGRRHGSHDARPDEAERRGAGHHGHAQSAWRKDGNAPSWPPTPRLVV